MISTVLAGQKLRASTLNAIINALNSITSSSNVDTLQSTASTAYTDLATVGPTVTLTLTGTSALVIVTAYMVNTGAGNNNYIACAVSGASTVAASDAKAASMVGTTAVTATAAFFITGLTPGSNVFTAKYRVSAGSGNFVYRNLSVIPVP